MCTRLTFLKLCGGLKVEGRINREASGFVKFPFSAQRVVDAKERTAAPIVSNLILKDGGRPAEELNRGGKKDRFRGLATVRL